MSDDAQDDELARMRAEVSAKLESGEVPAALALLAAAIGGELGHAFVPDYLTLAVRSANPSAVEQLIAAGRGSWPRLEPAIAIAIANAVAQVGLFQLALELSQEGPLATDREAATLRGGCALMLNRPDEAVAAADVAIAGLLHEGLSVAEFIRLTLRRAPAEGLLRYERSAVANIRELHEPLALRWEALRRSGKRAEAREMRSVCIQHFPERASVWATAGNQALDEGEPDQAERYFDRCLQLDPNWPAALAGKAIVFEIRKDWINAFRLRERVVELTQALASDDPASLHRVMRYASALARVGRWQDAEPLFRRCLALGAYDKLPPERPVFARVFSRELYAPAIIASLYATELPADPTTEEDLKLALREASALGAIFGRLRADEQLPAPERLGLLGMCAWLAGDPVRAYTLLDEAELEDAPDLALHYLLAHSAAALRADDRASIDAFALAAAAPVRDRAARGEPTTEPELLYARLIAARSGEAAALEGLVVPPAEAAPDEALAPRLRRLVAYRAAARATGRSALEAARTSAAELEAIVTA